MERSTKEVEIKKIEQCVQSQESLKDQMASLISIANKFGLYDAADFLGLVVRRSGIDTGAEGCFDGNKWINVSKEK